MVGGVIRRLCYTTVGAAYYAARKIKEKTMITSKDNDLIKHIKSLNQKKYRDEYGEYFIEGIKMVLEAIEEKAPIKEIILCEELLQKEIDTKDFKVEFVDKKVFASITDTVSPQGILAVLEKQHRKIEDAQIIFALDDVQDPGNVGTIIRTLDCAGIKNLMVSSGSGDVYNPKVVRSTMGAIFRINIESEADLLTALLEKQKAGYQIVVTSLEASEYYTDLSFKEKTIVVIGNESKGVKKEIQAMANIKTKIPMLRKNRKPKC